MKPALASIPELPALVQNPVSRPVQHSYGAPAAVHASFGA